MFENKLSFLIHGNAADPSEGAAAYLEKLLSLIDAVVANGPGVLMPEFFPGLAVMPNIHPLVVHFPIAFLSAFFILDLVASSTNNENWRKTASTLLYFGVISVFAAVAAGFQAAETLPHDAATHEIMEKHEHYGLTVAFLTIILTIWRLFAKTNIRGFGNFIHLLLAALIVLIMSLGADLGGLMVYGHGAGVKVMDSRSFQHDHGSSDHDHNHNYHH